MDGSRIILAAHRGDKFNFPENTMPAFESAVNIGVVYILMSRDIAPLSLRRILIFV